MAKRSKVYTGSEWVDLASSATDLSNYPTLSGFTYGSRNLLINGDFKIWQRGSSFTLTGAGATNYTADRLAFFRASEANCSVTRQASDLNGFLYVARVQRTAGTTGTGPIYIGSSFESNGFTIPLRGTPLTFSFYARSGSNYSAAGSALKHVWETGTGTDLGFTIVPTSPTTITTNLTLTTSWQRFTVQLPAVPSTATASRHYFEFTPVGTAGTNDFFEITGMQLEKGTVATPFEQRPIGIEMQLCQRYYQTSYPLGTALQASTNPTDGATFICINTSDSGNGGPLPVAMRSAPTFAIYSANGGVGANSARNDVTGADVTAITLAGGNEKTLPRLSKGGGLGTVGTPFNAHWTASAEL